MELFEFSVRKELKRFYIFLGARKILFGLILFG